jgi:sulfite reductase (NADPH) flavoprotein alpha-component
MADCEVVDWDETKTCLLVCSTAGDGVPPVAAKPFFECLERGALDLSGVRYGVLALGDRSYPNFCRAGRTLDEHVRRAGARALWSRVDVDKEDMSAVRGWLGDVRRTLAAAAAWVDCPPESPEDGLHLRARQHFARSAAAPDAPTRTAPFPARVLCKRRLSEVVDASDSETVHVELAANVAGEAPAITWQPGDALGVFASNCEGEVDAVLAALACDGGELVDLPRGEGRVTLRDALIAHLDIKQIRPADLKALGAHCGDPAAYCSERELVDLLCDFPSAARQLEARALVALRGPIRPRFYSIASSQAAAPDRICLSVRVVRYETLGRARTGLATTYLADRVGEGDRVPVFVQANPEFRLPAEGAGRACVMIGAGCGVAPYRAFLEEFEQRARRGGRSLLAEGGGQPHLLFFGSRHEKRDFLYADEWSARQADGGLRVFTAFSRDQREKIYVQDRMREHGDLLWQRMEAGDHFYICGDAARMAPDVERALLEIVQVGGGRSAEAAAVYLDGMRGAGRLQKDVWLV